jgi:anti-sigma-K factor RskA
MEHSDFDDSAGAYVLGALPDDELRAFEAHLDGCAACRDEIAALRFAADALALAADPIAPPPELKQRLMAVVRSEAELLDAAGARADVPQRSRRPRRAGLPGWTARGLRPAAIAGASAVLVAGGVTGYALRGDGGGSTRTVVASVDRAAAPDASASLRLGGGHGTLHVQGLRNPPARRVYQVWLKRSGETPEPTNALFTVRSDGTADVEVPGDLHDVRSVLVTSEPLGGSSVPSGQPIISVTTA